MDVNARVDYFRSEIKGDIERLEKRMAEQHTENLRILREFEKRLEKLTVDCKNLEMSVR
jgi:hypothetical protein